MISKKKRLIKRRLTKKIKGGNNIIRIKKPSNTEMEYLYPIFNNIYPNKKIEFTDSDDNDLVIKSNEESNEDNKKYIFYSGESSELTKDYSFKDPNCMAKILSTQKYKDIN